MDENRDSVHDDRSSWWKDRRGGARGEVAATLRELSVDGFAVPLALLIGPTSGRTIEGGSWKSSSDGARWASFLGDIYAGGGECSMDPADSFATW